MNNFKIFIGTILIALFSIVLFSFFKVQKNHEELTTLVAVKRMEEAAMDCYREDVCGETIVLGDLIRLGYAKEEVNPVTKMYYNHKCYFEKKENTFHFIEVNS